MPGDGTSTPVDALVRLEEAVPTHIYEEAAQAIAEQLSPEHFGDLLGGAANGRLPEWAGRQDDVGKFPLTEKGRVLANALADRAQQSAVIMDWIVDQAIASKTYPGKGSETEWRYWIQNTVAVGAQNTAALVCYSLAEGYKDKGVTAEAAIKNEDRTPKLAGWLIGDALSFNKKEWEMQIDRANHPAAMEIAQRRMNGGKQTVTTAFEVINDLGLNNPNFGKPVKGTNSAS